MTGRVLIVQASSGMRGPQRTVVSLAAWLGRRRDVTLAAPRGWVLKEATRRSPEIEALPLPGTWVADPVASARRLRTIARIESPSIIHANGLRALGIAAPAARSTETPVLVHAHGSELTSRARTVLRAWRMLEIDVHVYGVSRTANALLATSSLGARVDGILPNPIDADLFDVEPPAFGSPVRIGVLASRSPHKGLERLIRVAAAMRDDDVVWRVFGVRPRENDAHVRSVRHDAILAGIADRIEWMGAFSRPVAAFGSFDVLVVPSDRESFCRAAVEGMASGRPVVATAIPGLSEIVVDGTSGLLFDPERPEDGATAIRRVIADPDLRSRLVAGGRRTATEHAVERIGPQLEAIYRRLTLSPAAAAGRTGASA